MMIRVYKRRRQTDHIPLDLIVEILKKLPAKSLVRFRGVSKEWSTIIGSRRDFIDSIVTRSLAQWPLLILHHSGPKAFFTVSSSFPQITKHAVSIPGSDSCYSFEYIYARGLICCFSLVSHLVTIYNPTTRQSVPLPVLEPPAVTRFLGYYIQPYHCHFGYDPVTNQYKVLSNILLDSQVLKQSIYVFTLGGSQSWKEIQQGFHEKLFPEGPGVCIDGTIYYGATTMIEEGEERERGETVLLSFDIRSERFDHVCAPESMLKALSSGDVGRRRTLVNYLGELGCLDCSSTTETSLWIMKNAEKQEWSKITFSMPDSDPLFWIEGTNYKISSGVTPAGNIFVTKRYSHGSLNVYYYNKEKPKCRKVIFLEPKKK